jgi:hypothetical protein
MTIRDETTSHSASDSVSAGSTCMSLEASMRLSLEAPRTANAESPLTSSLSPSAEDAEELRRLEHWKESPFAVGLVDVTWADSRRREKEFQLQASAWLCPLVGARRVGNMAVLKQSIECHDEKQRDGSVQRKERPKLQCMVGPYWIVPAFFTYPIILIVSFWTARKVIYQHVALIAVWCTLTFIMILSLSLVACRNPGIMYRQVEMPGEGWLWNDQARTFRPKNAKFDPDCQAVIEGFDHTCPWTGTGIGRQNICAFRVFLGSLVACLILDIIIITNPF